MSCYLTDPETIGKIARWAADHCDGFHNQLTGSEQAKLSAGSIARILGNQNLLSCEARYPEHGPAGGFLDDGVKRVDYVNACAQMACKRDYNSSPAAIWRMTASLEHQSRETGDWIKTDAYWICHAIKEAAGKKMAEDLVSVEARRWT